MRIYTRTGDSGETGLLGGGRVPKDAARVEAYGTVDELNALLGMARAMLPEAEEWAVLERVQNELFDLGAALATPAPDGGQPQTAVTPEHITHLEAEIDRLEAELPPLRAFILPGGSPGAAALHVARGVCRRAERRVVALARLEAVDPGVVRYLNRLSDLLFVAARAANARAGAAETIWRGKA